MDVLDPGDLACSTARAVAREIAGRTEELLGDLVELAGQDSGTGDDRDCAHVGSMVEEWFAPYGTVRRTGWPPTLLIEVGDVREGCTPLVLCHYDTVWPSGTAATWPVERRDGWIGGPGVLDMKGSIVVLRRVIELLSARAVRLEHGVRLLFTPDEERANPLSAPTIDAVSRRSSVALVLEPPMSGGELKTARKGYARLRYTIRGRAAHAGISPREGASAAVAAANLILAAHRLNDPGEGTTVNVGVLSGGVRANVVAPSAELLLEVRADSEVAMSAALAALRRQPTDVPGTTALLSIEGLRAPMTRTKGTALLFGVAARIASVLGFELRETSTGGVSEGNLTHAAGTPTLDGLGLVGVGAHTRDEAIEIGSIAPRAGLLAGLLVSFASAVTPDRRHP